jgi:hypothetical protein
MKYILFVISFFILQNSYSQDSVACRKAIESLAPNFQGVTSKGNPYSIRAIKNKKRWVIVLTDSATISVFHKVKDSLIKKENINRDNLCMIISKGWIKTYKEPTLLLDLTLFGYYKFTKDGRKMYNALNIGNEFEKVNGAAKSVLLVLAAPFKIFGKKNRKMKAMQKELNKLKQQQQQIEKNKKEVDKMEQNVDKINKS